MISWGNVPLNSVLPFPFDAFDGGTGASITLTGLAITDVEIYKGISMTQRSSDAGVVLLDTDGIDLDGVTGIHGFSIDTSDNTDAGFYVADAYYYVVVSAVTIDAQTVNFVAGTFRLVAALNNLSAAQVNAEVVDALNVDTYAEPGQEAPGATVSLVKKIGYLYKSWRNKKTQTATVRSLFADDGTTVDQKATDGDDATTYTKGELGTGP